MQFLDGPVLRLDLAARTQRDPEVSGTIRRSGNLFSRPFTPWLAQHRNGLRDAGLADHLGSWSATLSR